MATTNEWPTTSVTLLSQIRDAGDREAWRSFVDRYAPIVYGYCRCRGLQHADAQNVSQEVFGRVSQAIQRFEYDAERGRFRSWLGLITHQQLIRHCQLRSRAGKALAAASEILPEEFSHAAEGAWIEAFNGRLYGIALERIRGEFEPLAWRAFLRVWDGRERPGDVARELDVTPQWVYQTKHKVLQRLRESLEFLAADVPTFHRS